MSSKFYGHGQADTTEFVWARVAPFFQHQICAVTARLGLGLETAPATAPFFRHQICAVTARLGLDLENAPVTASRVLIRGSGVRTPGPHHVSATFEHVKEVLCSARRKSRIKFGEFWRPPTFVKCYEILRIFATCHRTLFPTSNLCGDSSFWT